jgi:murein DD-endopeptidase MepM/ murein hydrolase activator NlpD
MQMDIQQVLSNAGAKNIVLFDPKKDRMKLMDFTAANANFTEEMINDLELFSRYVSTEIADARYGIGGYDELREVYSRSKVFDATTLHDEPRRLHLGIDIWGPADTEVFSPLDGHVHSFAFNDFYGDYGATIILENQAADLSFYCLYGHLSLKDLEGLYAGKKISKGELFAHFGKEAENGHWPPHLHFQVILDMENKLGDYPGVCKMSEREIFLRNCPNPDWLIHFLQWAK